MRVVTTALLRAVPRWLRLATYVVSMLGLYVAAAVGTGMAMYALTRGTPGEIPLTIVAFFVGAGIAWHYLTRAAPAVERRLHL